MRRAAAWLSIVAIVGLVVGRAALAGAPPPPKPDEAFRAIAKSLRLAIADLASRFGPEYPKGREFTVRLDALERHAETAGGEGFAQLNAELEALQREALTANPLVSRHPILFVVRPQYRPDHHNTATMFQTGEINTRSFQGGGALKAIDFGAGGEEKNQNSSKSTNGRVRTLIELPKGIARDPELSFDGKRILFSMRRDIQDDYHIYEINADGSGLRQLTFGAACTDIDPLYLPDGRIAFTSTREPKYCMCNRHIMGNLFRMEADGADLTQIGRSTLHEGHGSLTPDGRILYDRWEYVDRNFGDAQGVWTCNPDGTNHAIYWGNNTPSPGAVLDPRIIPGTDLLIATLSSCHDRPWGAIGIIDRRRGLDGRGPVLRTWPANAISLVMVGGYDTFSRVRPRYEDPFPLSDSCFLCSREVRDGQMGICLLDLFGNEVLLHAEPPGCFDPMPLSPRPRPLPIPDRINLARAEGYFFIYDVYVGTGMERVPRGTIRWIRVVQSPEKRYWTGPDWQGSGTQAPGMAWNDFNNKRILGIAPVEADGSAYFAVPTDRFVYFQLLDENGMMVQSMRSGTIARPGEVAGCIGCHEDRLTTVPNRLTQAIQRPPSPLRPWHGEPRNFSYTAEVQPVFDRHCVSCHDFGKPAGQKLNLAGDLTLSFNVSYMELRHKNYVTVVGAGPANTLPPYAWGSHRSKLAEVLLKGCKGHEELKLDPEGFDRIVTWIDINAPYYPEYSSVYPKNLHGRSPLDGTQLRELSRLTGFDLTRQSQTPNLSLTRPELSPCLAKLDRSDPRYPQALAIIRAGKDMLAKNPREDMPGSHLEGTDLARCRRYEAQARVEAEMRKAIIEGRRLFANRDSKTEN